MFHASASAPIAIVVAIVAATIIKPIFQPLDLLSQGCNTLLQLRNRSREVFKGFLGLLIHRHCRLLSGRGAAARGFFM